MAKIELHATNVDPRVIPMCEEGVEVRTWTRPELEFIYFFVEGTYSGEGRILKLLKTRIPGLTAYLDAASVEISAVQGKTCVLNVIVDIPDHDFIQAQQDGWPPRS